MQKRALAEKMFATVFKKPFFFISLRHLLIVWFCLALIFTSCRKKESSPLRSGTVSTSADLQSSDEKMKTEATPAALNANLKSDSEGWKLPKVRHNAKNDKISLAPLVIRYKTPGFIRYALDFDAPLSFIRWSPLAGLVVSEGEYVHNVTSRGLSRWKWMAGKGHSLYKVKGQEILWSPRFHTLTQLLRYGKRGWKRKWTADLAALEDGLFLIDAATVSFLGTDGSDLWRVALEGLRRIRGPYKCNDGVLFHGVRGLEGISVAVSGRGVISKEIILERGAVVLGAAPDCTPVVWYNSKVAELANTGKPKWLWQFKNKVKGTPLFLALKSGYLLINAKADAAATAAFISLNGKKIWSTSLPVEGRIMKTGAIESDNRIDAIGICKDVSSPCARRASNRGPYNLILQANASGGFYIQTRTIKGHSNMVPYPYGGYITAISATADKTELTLRDSEQNVVWSKEITGRLSAGPALGPEGEVYIGTCFGWECAPPYRFYSVTGREAPPDKSNQ
jgi:hypothetical protein